MKDAQDFDCLVVDAISNDERRAGDDQLSRFRHTAFPPCFGIEWEQGLNGVDYPERYPL
jgi:hypothetical protein